MLDEYELEPMYSNRQSFYMKARVIEDDEKKVLVSYMTKVCEVDKETGRWRILCDEDDLSNTTCSHIKEFLLQEVGIEYSKKDYVANLK